MEVPRQMRSMTSLYDDVTNGPGCKMYMRVEDHQTSRARDETTVNQWWEPVH